MVHQVWLEPVAPVPSIITLISASLLPQPNSVTIASTGTKRVDLTQLGLEMLLLTIISLIKHRFKLTPTRVPLAYHQNNTSINSSNTIRPPLWQAPADNFTETQQTCPRAAAWPRLKLPECRNPQRPSHLAWRSIRTVREIWRVVHQLIPSYTKWGTTLCFAIFRRHRCGRVQLVTLKSIWTTIRSPRESSGADALTFTLIFS